MEVVCRTRGLSGSFNSKHFVHCYKRRWGGEKKAHKHVDKSFFFFPEVKLKRKHKGQQEATPGSWVLNYHGKRINTHRNVRRCKFSKQRRRRCAFTGTHHLLCNLISSSFLSWTALFFFFLNERNICSDQLLKHWCSPLGGGTSPHTVDTPFPPAQHWTHSLF